jgi:putative transposase
MHIEFRHREYRIEERLPNGEVRILDIAFNESISIKECQLFEAFFADELEFLGDTRITQVQRKVVQSFVDDFNRLKNNDARKVEAIRRLSYLNAIEASGVASFNKETVAPLIEKVYQEIQDKKRKPHWTTVIYTWRPPWVISGKDPRSLVSNYKKCGNRKPKFLGVRKKRGEKFTEDEKSRAQEVDNIIDEEIKRALLLEKPVSIAEVSDGIELRIFSENKFRDSNGRLPTPSGRGIYDVVNRLDPYERDKLLHGKQYADKKYKNNRKGAEYSRPLEREEFDDTKSDLFVIDTETRLPLGRPTFTFGIDCYSGMPAGMHNGFDGPGFLAVSECLLHAFQPKTYLKTLFPMVEGDWPLFGLPGEVGIDNGPAYISDALTYACLQLGVVIDHCPVRCPDAKPVVERFFRTENDKLLHQQPGTTFSDLFDRGDYNPLENAVISFDALMAIEHLFLVDIYARSPQEGRNNIPINLWKLGTKNWPPSLPRRNKDLQIILGYVEYRVINSSGISLFCLDYNSTELSLLRREMDGEKVALTYNPKDISTINVWNPTRDKYLTVPALDQAYAHGLSLWQHNVIKRYTRWELNMNTDKEALRRAKKKIQEIVDREWIKSGKLNTKAKLARWMGVRQPDYNSVLQIKSGGESAAKNQIASSAPPLMLTPGSPHFDGISNSNNDHEEQEGKSVDLNKEQQVEAGKLEMATSNKRSRTKEVRGKSAKKRKRDSKAGVAHFETREDSSAAGASCASDSEDIDMTGYEASYDLPKGETA